MRLYLISWLCVSGLALVLFLRQPSACAIGRRAYWHFLFEPWKAVSFVVATLLIVLVAPYTGDPTWDYVDGLFMSLFCYATAPWSVALPYRALQKQVRAREALIAAVVWLFSVSWSYDGYLLWRDGHYPVTWRPNLFASSVIYIGAGLFWNLEWQPGRGVIFSFMRPDWPSRPQVFAPWRLLALAMVLALPALMAVLMFFW